MTKSQESLHIFLSSWRRTARERKRRRRVSERDSHRLSQQNGITSLKELDYHIFLRNDPYTHFSQQLYNKLTWLVIFYYFFCFVLFSFCKKIIKYYQPRQLVVGLL
jgi:hypothetical protein